MKFKEFYDMLTEVADSKRNRESLATAYGLTDIGAAETIKQWNDVTDYIDKDWDYFGLAVTSNKKKYDPRDIYSWSRVSKDMGYDTQEAYSNLQAMITNLQRSKVTITTRKTEEKDYDLVYPTAEMIQSRSFPYSDPPEEAPSAYVYIPRRTGASCKLGANTRWCTAATKGKNHFDEYNNKGITLFYIIPKEDARVYWNDNDGGKIGLALWPNGREIQVFDEMDNTISWEQFIDIAEIRGLPHEKSFYAQWKGSIIKYLKYSADYAVNYLTGQIPADDEDEGMGTSLLDGLYKVAVDAAEDDKEAAEYIKYRREGVIDNAFMLEPMHSSTLSFYTDRTTNPVGAFTSQNKMYQDELVRNIRRSTYLTKQLIDKYSTDSDRWTDNLNEMDEIDQGMAVPFGHEQATDLKSSLRRYVSRHLSDDWPDLEEAVIKQINAKIELKEMDITAPYKGDIVRDSLDSSKMWLHIILDIKGRWDKFEDMMHKHVKSQLFKIPKNKSPWAGDHNGQYATRSNLLDINRWYNNVVNRLIGHGGWEQFLAYLPETVDHLVKYHDGEWSDDELPLTKSAEDNLKFKA